MTLRGGRGSRPGLTLVEVLVVVAIIGVLVGLLMPAMSGARESSRKTVCNNNLRQIAIASFAHLEQQGTFPSAGFNQGTPSGALGFHELQGGSWMYNILPYIELGHLRDVPSSQVRGTCPPVYRCPTTFSTMQTKQGEASYVGNAGTRFGPPPPTGSCGTGVAFQGMAPDDTGTLVWITNIPNQPASKQEILRQQSSGYPHATANPTFDPAVNPYFPQGGGQCTGPVTGVIALFGRVRASHVKDGLSKTFLAGERYDEWVDIDINNQTRSWVNGCTYHTVRMTISPPLSVMGPRGWDSENAYNWFGSRHRESFSMAMCDGSVRQVAFIIDPSIWRDAGTRNGYGDTSSGSLDD